MRPNHRSHLTATIARIEIFPINYPVAGRFKFFENQASRPMGRPAVIVKITAEDGTVGWGNGIPSPRWSFETLESVQTTVTRYLAPELIGLNPFDLEAINATTNRAIARCRSF